MLKRWTDAGRLMLDEMGLEDMAMLKGCLLSAGMLFGIGIPRKLKKPAALFGGALFLGTYLPLIGKFLACLTRSGRER